MSESENNTQENNGGETATTQGEEKTFTQDELNEIVQKRISRYSDYEVIKSERDALLTEKDKGDWRNEVFNEARSEAQKSANDRLVAAEARSHAVQANFVYPDDAIRYLDVSTLETDENGFIKSESVKSQIDKIMEERPALVRSNPTTAKDVGLGRKGESKPLNSRDAFIQSVSD